VLVALIVADNILSEKCSAQRQMCNVLTSHALDIWQKYVAAPHEHKMQYIKAHNRDTFQGVAHARDPSITDHLLDRMKTFWQCRLTLNLFMV
jgi:hypothetical protein